LGNLPYLAPQGYSNYNAFVLHVEKRFSRGLSLLANYTWSRALGVAPAVTNAINNVAVQNPLDLKREYGPLEFDVINRVSISGTYDLPFGPGRRFLDGGSRVLKQMVGGWQVASIATFQGGFPLTPGLGVSLGRTFTNSRPNIIGDTTDAPRRPDHFLNRAAFAIPSSAEVTAGNFFGNAGRSSLRSAGLTNFDFSLMKYFALREGLRLQFRGEVFNLTNTPYFGSPGGLNTNFSSPAFGAIGIAGPPRVVQLALKLIF
jgi:hypothetical protein